ncbi:hypothetical protein C8R32_101186 [Nitrosospira sp. Nsp5]|uniref:Uncharacterized protein n=1 Tax=Nitrosospira multiformis TaxID=1231 RepID=A0ABY0TGC0_9PROT|nr:hypothetical protein C8R32_101186 [Nitrosospira sp. Nsp5]SDQ78511.1 hypothetical protein SAMN05216402_2276 [Nitrosospira multiformis]
MRIVNFSEARNSLKDVIDQVVADAGSCTGDDNGMWLIDTLRRMSRCAGKDHNPLGITRNEICIYCHGIPLF